jgi:hypothetical protein
MVAPDLLCDPDKPDLWIIGLERGFEAVSG